MDTNLKLADVKTDDDGKFVAAPEVEAERLRTSHCNKLVEVPIPTPEWWTVTRHHVEGTQLPFGDLSTTTWTAGDIKTTTEMREHIEGGKKTGKPLKRINLQYTIETRRVVATFPGGTAIFREERIIPDGRPAEFKTKLIRTTVSNRVDYQGYHPTKDLLSGEAKVDAVQRMEKLRAAMGDDLWNALWRLCVDQVAVSNVGEGDKREAEATGAMAARFALRVAAKVYIELVKAERDATVGRPSKPLRTAAMCQMSVVIQDAPKFRQSMRTDTPAGFNRFDDIANNLGANIYRSRKPPVFVDGMYGAPSKAA